MSVPGAENDRSGGHRIALLASGIAAFLMVLGLTLWSESAAAVFLAMVEAGLVLCQ